MQLSLSDTLKYQRHSLLSVCNDWGASISAAFECTAATVQGLAFALGWHLDHVAHLGVLQGIFYLTYEAEAQAC